MILATTTTAGQGSGMSMIILMVGMVAIMYLLMIRPQRKEQKRMQLMLSQMAVGDAVVTQSGFYGIVIDISEDDVIVEFGNNRNCRIPMKKAAIAQVEKPEQAAAQAAAEKAAVEKTAKDAGKKGEDAAKKVEEVKESAGEVKEAAEETTAE